MSKYKKLVCIICNLILIGILILSITIDTKARTMKVVSSSDVEIQYLGNDTEIEWDLDTQEDTICGIQIKCFQSGRVINSGYFRYKLYNEDEEVEGTYNVSLMDVNLGTDYLNLEFEKEIKGRYSIRGVLSEIKEGDSLAVYINLGDTDSGLKINGKGINGNIVDRYIVQTSTNPYIFDIVLLIVFVNILLGLYMGKEL